MRLSYGLSHLLALPYYLTAFINCKVLVKAVYTMLYLSGDTVVVSALFKSEILIVISSSHIVELLLVYEKSGVSGATRGSLEICKHLCARGSIHNERGKDIHLLAPRGVALRIARNRLGIENNESHRGVVVVVCAEDAVYHENRKEWSATLNLYGNKEVLLLSVIKRPRHTADGKSRYITVTKSNAYRTAIDVIGVFSAHIIANNRHGEVHSTCIVLIRREILGLRECLTRSLYEGVIHVVNEPQLASSISSKRNSDTGGDHNAEDHAKAHTDAKAH